MENRTTEATKLMADCEQAMLVFAEIQQAHTLSLQRNQLAKIGMWHDERSKALGLLQQALGAVWRCDMLRADARLGESLHRRIGQMIEREQGLAEHVKSCQAGLKSEMGKMRKGKQAMGGYGATGVSRSSGLCFRNSL